MTEEGVFVSFAAPGDLVEIEPDGKRARLVRVIEPSPDRVTPPCIHFGVCGACQTQHIAPDAYRAWKRGLVVRALESAGIETTIADLVDAHGEGRRRVTLALKHGTAGYHRRGSHEVMAAEMCPILSPGLANALPFARALAAEMPEKWLSMLCTATESGIDADLKGPLHGNARLNARLAAIAREHGLARLTAEREPIALFRQPTLGIGPVATLVPPPGVFLQPTLKGEETLAHLACDVFRRARRVADLFCGVGPFAIRLAAWSRVWAYDTDGLAVAALRRAAAVPGFKPVIAERRDLFARPLTKAELEQFDAVVLDPPFDGAASQCAELAKSNVPMIRYVSCGPQSFARDARTLIDGGYTLAKVTPVDQFLYTPHVELVAEFMR